MQGMLWGRVCKGERGKGGSGSRLFFEINELLNEQGSFYFYQQRE